MGTSVMGSVERRNDELARARDELARYLEYLRGVRQLSPHTVRSYGGDIESYLEWCEREGIPALSVSHRQLRRYLAYMTSARYADKTINRRLSSLRSFFLWLERDEVADASAVVSLPGRKLAKALPKVLTNEEAARIIDTCDTTTDEGIRDRAFIELLYATGARISEIAGLRPADVDYDEGQVRLFGKGSKERIVPVYRSALDAVLAYMRAVRPRLAACRRRAGVCERVFVSTRGNDMSSDALRTCFERHVQAAGLSGSITPHVMRHTFATELLDGGADLKTVQELLGHEGLDTTQIYTHLSIDRLKNAAIQAHPRGQEPTHE